MLKIAADCCWRTDPEGEPGGRARGLRGRIYASYTLGPGWGGAIFAGLVFYQDGLWLREDWIWRVFLAGMVYDSGAGEKIVYRGI